MYKQRSFQLKSGEKKEKWFVVDATDNVVGRLATSVASILRGKHSAQYTPHTDSGDCVIVVNADKVKFSGKKWQNKVYYRHTGHIGGLKKRTAKELLEKDPTAIVLKAVKGMLPNTPLGRKQLKKLRVYAGDAHKHTAQNPQNLQLG